MRGQSLTVPLQSPHKREQFLLDLSRGRIDLLKVKMQSRARQVMVLAPIDLSGAPHRNPDDQEIPGPPARVPRGLRRQVGRAVAGRPISQPGGCVDNHRGLSGVLQYHATAPRRAFIHMMIQDLERLLHEYLAWLKDKTVLRQIDD
jgi:hypothetical protein